MNRVFPSAASAILILATLLSVGAHATDAETLLNERCASCHQPLSDGGLSRISEIRKTPEGWDMTIVRMMLLHGVQLASDERQTLVKLLSDQLGLAPAETAPWRYILERQPNVIESPPDDDLAVMCARCHSYARVALQRRDRGEWLKHSHFHVGQFPTIEYQALGRDRNWWDLASNEVPGKLARLYPFDTASWNDWQAADKPSPAGAWRIVGEQPGRGRYTGSAAITSSGQDSYQIELNLSYADGQSVTGQGDGIVYTGYEWRARVQQGGESVLQVLALSEDGQSLSGRWFLNDNDALGSTVRLVRMGDAPVILSVEPPYIKAGETANLLIHGINLAQGDINLGEGVSVEQILHQGAAAVAIRASAAATAAAGTRTVQLGDAQGEGLLTVYDQIDAVRVEPDYAIARVGNAEGPVAPVPAQFDAVAYMNGPDDLAGTDDDIRIGSMPASWSVDNANETAAAMQDAKFAGQLSATGLFQPAGAGPNPARRYQTNNAGELSINATIGTGDEAVSGSARLVVTVQRWNDPPIR